MNGEHLDRWREKAVAGEPHDVLNGMSDREKDASRMCFLIQHQERMVPVEQPAQENTA